jgi:hypothetical protein
MKTVKLGLYVVCYGLFFNIQFLVFIEYVKLEAEDISTFFMCELRCKMLVMPERFIGEATKSLTEYAISG